MDINRLYRVEEVLEAARDFIQHTNRKVMLEYVLLQEQNDFPWQAQLLADLLKDDDFHVNLIPYNTTQNLGFQQSEQTRIATFYNILKQNHIVVTMRREFGSSVNAACGQLRADYEMQQ